MRQVLTRSKSTFSFEATIYEGEDGAKLRFRGPTRDFAWRALMNALRERNFSKITITDLACDRDVGLLKMVNHGKYAVRRWQAPPQLPEGPGLILETFPN